MKFQVQSKLFQQQLSAVSKVISGKSALSILDNFLLELNDGVLTITGSDQENTMQARLEVAESEGSGSVAVNSKRILDILKEMPDQGLTFYVNDESYEIDINFLNGHFRFVGVDGTEYPQKKEQDEETVEISVPASVIASGIENTLFAASVETIRPIMTGVCWDIKDDRMIFVASDTHKLVKYENMTVNPGIERQFVLPAKPASILKGLLAKEENDIRILIDSKSARFEFGDFILSCRFIKGAYPPYERVIPKDNPFVLDVDRVNLLSAMRRVGLLANMASSLVRFNIQNTEVLLSSQDIDYSTSAEERVPCNYTGSPMTIGFQAGYMIELLNNLKGDTVICKLADPAHAGLFMPSEQSEGENIVMLLMPMQVLDY